MVNRYTEIDFNQPISSYVPQPLDFIYKAGLQKQKQYDEGVEASNKLNDLLATVNAIDAHKSYKKALADKYYPQIEDIADRIVNKGDLTAKRDLNKIARQWEHDPIRQELEQSFANYKLYQQDKIKKGEKYAEWHDPTLGFVGEGEGGPNAFRYTGMGERTDHQKRAHDMMAGIAEDAAKSAGFKINPDGTITKGGSGSEHIFSKKVQELAAMKAQDFLTTSEGQDFAKQLRYYNPNITGQDLMNQATKYLYDAGANQIFKKTESQSDVGFVPEWMHEQTAANMGPSASTSEISASRNEDLIPKNLQHFLTNDGKISIESMQKGIENKSKIGYVTINGKDYTLDNLPKGYTETYRAKGGSGKGGAETVVKTPDGKLLNLSGEKISKSKMDSNIKELGEFVAKAMTRFGLKRSGNAVEDANKTLEFIKSYQTYVNTGTNYDNYPNLANAITDAAKGGKDEATMFTNMEASNLDGTGKIDAQEFLKSNDIDPKSVRFSEYDFSEPGKKKWVGINSDGEQVSFTMTSKDVNEKNHFKAISDVNNDIKKYVTNQDVKYKLESASDESGNDIPMYRIGEVRVDKDGNKIQAAYLPNTGEFYLLENDKPINYNQYREAKTNDWIKSKYGIGLLQGKSDKVGNIK